MKIEMTAEQAKEVLLLLKWRLMQPDFCQIFLDDILTSRKNRLKALHDVLEKEVWKQTFNK